MCVCLSLYSIHFIHRLSSTSLFIYSIFTHIISTFSAAAIAIATATAAAGQQPLECTHIIKHVHTYNVHIFIYITCHSLTLVLYSTVFCKTGQRWLPKLTRSVFETYRENCGWFWKKGEKGEKDEMFFEMKKQKYLQGSVLCGGWKMF